VLSQRFVAEGGGIRTPTRVATGTPAPAAGSSVGTAHGRWTATVHATAMVVEDTVRTTDTSKPATAAVRSSSFYRRMDEL
jgi:hypothetical protein